MSCSGFTCVLTYLLIVPGMGRGLQLRRSLACVCVRGVYRILQYVVCGIYRIPGILYLSYAICMWIIGCISACFVPWPSVSRPVTISVRGLHFISSFSCLFMFFLNHLVLHVCLTVRDMLVWDSPYSLPDIASNIHEVNVIIRATTQYCSILLYLCSLYLPPEII